MGRSPRRVTLALLAFAGVALGVLSLGPAFATADGGLEQKPGVAGCISDLGTGGECQDGVALGGASAVAVSVDGKNAYAASSSAGAVVILDRDPATGALTQKPATDGCISEDGTAGNCVDGVALGGAASVTVSPDGKNVYVASGSSSGVAIFDRDPATGSLTQKPGSAGCVSEDGTGGLCQNGVALDTASSVTVSADGKNAYVTALFGNAVAVFDRDTVTGALTQKSAPAGCVSETGNSGNCQDGIALVGAQSVALSPDGTNAYVASRTSDAVAVFDRDPATGALTRKPGTAGCISETGTSGDCQKGIALAFATSVSVSPDGKNAYVASANGSAIVILDRDAGTGALTQKTGTAGCISDSGTGGDCQDGVGLGTAFSVVVSPDGRNVYATSAAYHVLTIFDRDPVTGALTQKPGPAGCISDAGIPSECRDRVAIGPNFVAVSPDGKSAYTAAYSAGAVAVLDRTRHPVCEPQARSFTQGAPGEVALSCSHPDGFPVTYEIVQSPQKGTLTGFDPAIGKGTYMPNATATGTDTIGFRATSARGDSIPVTVSITILPTQASPTGPASSQPSPPGLSLPPRLAISTAKKSLVARTGFQVRLRYVTNAAGTATLEVRRAGRRVALVRKAARLGANTIIWNGRIGRKAASAGRYEFRLTVNRGSERATLRVLVRLRR